MPRPADPHPPAIVERYLDRVAALDAVQWDALAKGAPFVMSVAGLRRWWRTARTFHAALRRTSIPARIAAARRLNEIVQSTHPPPTREAIKAVRDGLYGLLTRDVVSAEFFERAYQRVAAIIPLGSIA